MQKDDNHPKQTPARPRVPYVKVLDNDNLAECPADQYHLVQITADLDYSRDHKGGSVVQLPIRLSYCPVCKTWYIDHLRLAALARQGADLRCIDLIGSATYPRSDAYKVWHPLPVVTEVASKTGSSRKSKSIAQPETTVKTKSADLNLAVNCLYCDGGKAGRSIGYRGVCTQDNYFGNVTRQPEAWCANPGNRCRDFRPDDQPAGEGLCFECQMLTDWSVILPADQLAGAGSLTGGITVATTVLPRESEANRRVFAVFAIAGQAGQPAGLRIQADSRQRFELLADEPVYFWKALTSKGQPDPTWHGNYRPVNQAAIVRILHRSVRAIKEADRRAVAERMLKMASARYSTAQLEKILS